MSYPVTFKVFSNIHGLSPLDVKSKLCPLLPSLSRDVTIKTPTGIAKCFTKQLGNAYLVRQTSFSTIERQTSKFSFSWPFLQWGSGRNPVFSNHMQPAIQNIEPHVSNANTSACTESVMQRLYQRHGPVLMVLLCLLWCLDLTKFFSAIWDVVLGYSF